ncbi:hypothetical protein KKC44_05840 [Patescibacteria group bacterium]|nr:hypothetical protein [Patescibacteria group bacterium]MBU2260094.1 hypothetical protein [Patescibacteria group bacterium]
MDQQEIQKKIEGFLKDLGVPSFIVFGWQKEKGADPKHAQFGVVSSYHKVPTNVAIKGMSWALNDFISKSLK